MKLPKNSIMYLALGALAGAAYKIFVEDRSAVSYQGTTDIGSGQFEGGGYVNGVYYDDRAAAKPDVTLFGPFYNQYEDPVADADGPAGLTPQGMDIWPTIA